MAEPVEMEAQAIEMRRTMDASSTDRVDMEQRVGTMKGKLQSLSRVCDEVDSLEGQLSRCREELTAAMTAKEEAEQKRPSCRWNLVCPDGRHEQVGCTRERRPCAAGPATAHDIPTSPRDIHFPTHSLVIV